MSERASALAAGGVVRATGRRYALSFDAAGKGYTREPDQQHAPGLINRTVTHHALTRSRQRAMPAVSLTANS